MKHILMVDDNTTNLKMAASVLSPYYELSMAKSGKQAMVYLKKNKPDLILLDINMPEMDGYATMEEIKLNPDTADIPVIFLTADTEHDSEIKGLRMGALDFITKPFEETVMLGRIEKVLQMEDLRKQLSGQSSKEGGLEPVTFKSRVDSSIRNNNAGAFILVDLDEFAKAYHRDYGTEGRSYGAKFADIVKENIVNNPDNNAIFTHFDGDMFAIYLEAVSSEESVRKYIDGVFLNALKDANNSGIFTSAITASIGIYTWDMLDVPADYNSAYINADKALYLVKNTGKNNIHFYKK